MNKPALTDAQFIDAWKRAGHSPTIVRELTGLSLQCIYQRRSQLLNRGISLETIPLHPGSGSNGNGRGNQINWQLTAHPWSPRTDAVVRGGSVIVFSDAHYWPGIVTLAHKALLVLAKQLQPQAIIANGDVFDGANISRHDPLGWQKLPTVVEELDAAKLRLSEIERAAPKARRFFTVGNHDSRYDRRLASETAEFAGVSIVTGHLHAQLCRPFTDYRGTRYGVDCGTLADINGPQFSYTMDGPVNWRSGFAVLTFDDAGRLLPPELCEVQKYKDSQRAVFRGKVVCE